jgi:RNA polymerase sigma-70 factor (ECF subfamily)
LITPVHTGLPFTTSVVPRSDYALVISHWNSAFNLAYWILQSREDADGAVEDATVRAFRAFDAFAGAGVRALRLAIVRNVAYATLAARKVCEKLFEDLGFGEGLNLDARITRPLALPPIHRNILVLHEIERLSYAEISQIMGTAVGTSCHGSLAHGPNCRAVGEAGSGNRNRRRF